MAGLKQALCAGMHAMLLFSASTVPANERIEAGATTALSHEQGEAILHELKSIRQLLEKMEKQADAQPPAGRPAAPRTATVKVESDRFSLGAESAVVTVVEYTDYQCPYCRRFVQSTFPLLKRDFIDTGKVSWQVRDLPLGFHKDARKAAQAALCAGDQEHFWPMPDSLFRDSASLGIE
ncbi:MAG: thioredoxin domain-containing protein [Thiogranum sp.]|nr:thioredoxin domain-containing protein [Thiogranum sp.]